MPDFDFDFKKLAQQISAGGDFRRQPTSDIRMGVVIGYDPNYQKTTGKHSYPFVTVQLAGDKTPVHQTRFAEWYVPNLGDTVWCVLSGSDIWVMGSLAGAPKDVIGQLRSPVSILTSAQFSDTEQFTTIGQHNLSNVKLATPYLPNRIYRVEASVTFSVLHTIGALSSGISASNSGGSATVPSYTFPINTATIQMDFNTAAINGALTLPSNGVYVAGQTPNGYLSQLPGIINAAGPVYASYYGLAEGAQIVGCNWAASGTAFTGSHPTGAVAQAAPATGWYGTNPNPYEVYLNVVYAIPGSTGTAQYAKVGVIQINNVLPASTAPITTEPTIAASTSGKNTSYSVVSLGVIAPTGLSGAGTYQELANVDVTGSADNKTYTITGSKTFWEIPTQTVTPRTWNSANGGTSFTWQLALKLQGTGTTSSSFYVTNANQQMFVYDCGVAS